MNGLTLMIDGSLSWQGYMLMASHAGMAIQGLLYAPYYTIKLRHLVVASIWILHNDIIDYVFGMMPIYSHLTIYIDRSEEHTSELQSRGHLVCRLLLVI